MTVCLLLPTKYVFLLKTPQVAVAWFCFSKSKAVYLTGVYTVSCQTIVLFPLRNFEPAQSTYTKAGTCFAPVKVRGDCPSGAVPPMETPPHGHGTVKLPKSSCSGKGPYDDSLILINSFLYLELTPIRRPVGAENTHIYIIECAVFSFIYHWSASNQHLSYYILCKTENCTPDQSCRW